MHFSRILWYFVTEYTKYTAERGGEDETDHHTFSGDRARWRCAWTAGAADTSVITDMKTDCVVDAAGSCQITQTVTIDIAGTEDTIELPLASGAKRISVAGYNKKDDAGRLYGARSLVKRRVCRKPDLTISHTVSGLVSEQDKVQTLDAVLLLCTKVELRQLTVTDFTITLPAAFEGYPTFASGYYGDDRGLHELHRPRGHDRRHDLDSGASRTHESLTMTLDVGEGYFAGRYAS